MTISQLGAGPEMVVALDRRYCRAALPTRYAIPILQRGWPVSLDLSHHRSRLSSSASPAAEHLSKRAQNHA